MDPGTRQRGGRAAPGGVRGLAAKLTAWVVLLFALFLLVTLTGAMAAAQIIRARIQESVGSNLEQTDVLLTTVLGGARETGFLLSTNDYLVRYAALAPQPDRSRYQEYQLVSDLSLEVSYRADANPDIWSIYILFADGGQAITSEPDFRSGDLVKDLEWVTVAGVVDRSYEFIGHYQDHGLTERHFLSVVTRADIVNRGLKSRVVISVNIDEIGLYATLSRLRVTEGTRVYLLDGELEVICAGRAEELGRPLGEVAGFLAPGKPAGGPLRVRLPGAGPHLVVQRTNALSGWRHVVLVPERELFREQRVFLAGTVSFAFLASLALGALALRIVGANIRRPVATLVGFMERAEREHFRLRIEESRPDEIGYLYESFNSMVGRTRKLLDDLDQEHVLKREMELKLLQSQVDPHFLYNTLDTINWIAKEHGVEDISRIVLSLSTLYRALFNRGRDLIDVASMVRSLESYLYLQRYRFRNLAKFAFEVDPGAAELEVLNLVIQPIVENAVIHGMGPGVPGGEIHVKATASAGCVRFVVQDSGVGISPGKLEVIRRNLQATDAGEASGLRNVHRRVQLYYGPEHGLEIASVEGGGTTVTVDLPAARRPSTEPAGTPTVRPPRAS